MSCLWYKRLMTTVSETNSASLNTPGLSDLIAKEAQSEDHSVLHRPLLGSLQGY